MKKVNFSAIAGWDRLSENKQAQAVATRFFQKAQQYLTHESRDPKIHMSWLDGEFVDGELTGRLTAFAVTLQSGQIVFGIAPSMLSAQRRGRKLLRYGHCAAAGVLPP